MAESADVIEFDDFLKVEIRTGTIIEAKLNPKARVPAFALTIDFGALGTLFGLHVGNVSSKSGVDE